MSSYPPRPFPARVCAAAVCVIAITHLLACGEDTLVRARPPFTIVDGTPSVDRGLPRVDNRPPMVNPDDFANNAPLQVDVFFQKTVRKVDILWVVDNSGSMQDEQTSLAANFGAFITDLASADPPVDYHLGVITTDAAAERGVLRPLATDASKRYIACNENGATGCNVPDPETAFRQTIQVGTGGSPQEMQLLAAHRALTEPNTSGQNAGFLRDDAALYVIVVTDEGDGSCAPLVPNPSGSDYTSCTMQGAGCRCADTLDWGSVEYFVRFFEGLKGYGNEDLVAVAAIVATEQDPFSLCVDQGCTRTQTYAGCTGPGGVANYAPRLIQVAQQTGGVAISICQSDFSSALSALGFAVSGQRRDFNLSRRPVNPDQVPIKVFVQGDPSDPSTRREVPRSTSDGWDYVLCENGSFVNAIRFFGSEVPPPRARIEVVYQVNVGAGRNCN